MGVGRIQPTWRKGGGSILCLSLLMLLALGNCLVMHLRAVSSLIQDQHLLLAYLLSYRAWLKRRDGRVQCPKMSFLLLIFMAKPLHIVHIFFLMVLSSFLLYLFMQASSLYAICSQAFMLQTGRNGHHHGHQLHFGRKKFWENAFSPLNRSKIGSIAWSSLRGEMDFCFAGFLGVTLLLLWEWVSCRHCCSANLSHYLDLVLLHWCSVLSAQPGHT